MKPSLIYFLGDFNFLKNRGFSYTAGTVWAYIYYGNAKCNFVSFYCRKPDNKLAYENLLMCVKNPKRFRKDNLYTVYMETKLLKSYPEVFL